jgi:hypothetical protein
MFSRFQIAALAALVILPSSQSAELPSFQDYRVSNVYRGEAKPPDFGDPDQYSRCFQNPTDYAHERVNFAGHFVIGTCTCGSGCHYLFMWDALNGKFYRRFPFGPINIGPYGVGTDLPAIEYSGEQHVPDSALLIVDGCIEGTCDCGTRYYRWTGKRFQLLQRHESRVPLSCSR